MAAEREANIEHPYSYATATPFAGHDEDNGMTHMSIPELAGASTIATAATHGSRRARRQARVMGWVLIGLFVVPVVIGLLLMALGPR